jgi:hypothetical protein
MGDSRRSIRCDVRSGSKAKVRAFNIDVRFTPISGNQTASKGLPLRSLAAVLRIFRKTSILQPLFARVVVRPNVTSSDWLRSHARAGGQLSVSRCWSRRKRTCRFRSTPVPIPRCLPACRAAPGPRRSADRSGAIRFFRLQRCRARARRPPRCTDSAADSAHHTRPERRHRNIIAKPAYI